MVVKNVILIFWLGVIYFIMGFVVDVVGVKIVFIVVVVLYIMMFFIVLV